MVRTTEYSSVAQLAERAAVNVMFQVRVLAEEHQRALDRDLFLLTRVIQRGIVVTTSDFRGNTLRALVFDRNLKFDAEHSMPSIAPGESLVRVLRAGICNTDLEIVKAIWISAHPRSRVCRRRRGRGATRRPRRRRDQCLLWSLPDLPAR